MNQQAILSAVGRFSRLYVKWTQAMQQIMLPVTITALIAGVVTAILSSRMSAAFQHYPQIREDNAEF